MVRVLRRDGVAGLVTSLPGSRENRFLGNIDISPVEQLARLLYDEQIDEVVIVDNLASAERRGLDLDMVSRVS